MSKKYSKEKKQEVITARKQGATLKEISFRTGVSITTIKKWVLRRFMTEMRRKT